MIRIVLMLKALMVLCPFINHVFVMPASLSETPVLFEPGNYTWKDSKFSLPPEKDSLIIQYNSDKEKFQVLDWQGPNLNLPKGSPFVGYLYFRATVPIAKAMEILSTKEEGRF